MKIHPIGFRTHTHNLGTVVSGYKVNEAKEEWTIIGKMDPRRPQAFYPVADPDLVVNGGEYLAARCTMVRISYFESKKYSHTLVEEHPSIGRFKDRTQIISLRAKQVGR